MARPKIHDAELADRLLAEAAVLVAADGPDGLSLRRLADNAQTSTTAIYSLFGGKDQLLLALFERAFRSFGASQHGVAAGDDPAAELLALGRGYRRWALANPHLFQLMFGPGVQRTTPETQRLAEQTKEPLLAAVRRAQAAGRIAPGHDPEVVALGLWGQVHGLVTLELSLGGHAAVDPQAEAAFDACLAAAQRGWA
ncbi:TetR family transcriptional regulator [Enemella evansiae]|uniref:TetR/AcrR family transcriptional regulator n=1 Tax=Enemella evansiae TaxID=2016499 RepID=UPI000B971400|nr:TetR/AcrR family transcriptional regulator [Enemella evansiae]OYN95530.1 TetR family transcriptional regulator [Enemella evansiae]